MMRWFALGLLGLGSLHAQQSPIPMVDEMPGRPFAIKNTWVIGGIGDWGYLTLDPTARQLFVAHGPTVQVVDIDTGSVTGTVTGFRDAHQVVLDADGRSAYVADSSASVVRVVDRGTFRIVASIPTGPQPRSIVLEPSSGTLLAICAGPNEETRSNYLEQSGGTQNTQGRTPSVPPAALPYLYGRNAPRYLSTITLIDADKQQAIANVVVPGRLGFAQADGKGQVYVTVQDSHRIERFDAQGMRSVVRDALDAEKTKPRSQSAQKLQGLPLFDWSGAQQRVPDAVRPGMLSTGRDCDDPRGIAVDAQHNRLFVACSNQKMAVVNGDTGNPITSLTIGPGADAIAYDPNRSLIFTANGGGYGSVSVIRQHVTDTYAVIQNLPTLQQARTLAVDPSTGNVYLVTTLYGANLKNPPMSGIGTLKIDPVNGSFQVLVVGN